jgi:hypothetical protein
MNKPSITARKSNVLLPIIFLSAAGLLTAAGCGGGGSPQASVANQGTGTVTTTNGPTLNTNAVIDGTLDAVNGGGASGYTVRYNDPDTGYQQTTTTDTNGQFSLTIPNYGITGNDTLSFYLAGQLAVQQSVTPVVDATIHPVSTLSPPSDQPPI